MSLLRVEGWDHQNVMADILSTTGAFQWRDAGNISLTTGRFAGSKGVTFGSQGYLAGVLSTPIAQGFVGLAVYVPGTVGGGIEISFGDSSQQTIPSQCQLDVYLNSLNGAIELWRGKSGSGTLLYTSANNLFTNNTWFYLEINPTIGSSGGVNVAINGVTVITFSGNTQNGSNAQFDFVNLGSMGTVNDNQCIVDDFYLEDTVSGPGANHFNAFQGPVQVFTQFPVSNATVTFTPLANANWQEVSETAMDGDTSYNYSATAGNEDLFNIGTLPVGALPLAVQVTGAYRQDAAGTRQGANHLKSGTVDVTGGTVTLNQGYTYQSDVLPQDPNGDIAWTRTSVDAAQIGYKVVT